MKNPIRAMRNLNANKSNATVIEYGLIAAAIAVAIITAVNAIGADELKQLFWSIHN